MLRNRHRGRQHVVVRGSVVEIVGFDNPTSGAICLRRPVDQTGVRRIIRGCVLPLGITSAGAPGCRPWAADVTVTVFSTTTLSTTTLSPPSPGDTVARVNTLTAKVSSAEATRSHWGRSTRPAKPTARTDALSLGSRRAAEAGGV